MARDADGIIQIKWANSGDVGLGGIDVNEMWDITYSQPGGPLPQRIQFNQFYRWLSALAVEINQNGPFLDYSTLINYTVGAWVTGSDNFQYYCRVANGPGSTLYDPTSNPIQWKKGSNNDSLVIGADGAIDDGQLQVADETVSRMEISTGGAGGQGSARKAIIFNNIDANSYMDINCFDFDTSLGVQLRLNPNGGEVGIGLTPTVGKDLHVSGDVLFNNDTNMSGSCVVGANGTADAGLFQVADETVSQMEISTGGAGGQGSARKAIIFNNIDANSYMDINCFDFDTSLGVSLRLNPNGGEVGIGKTPSAGVELDVNGDIAASGTVSAGGKELVPDSTGLTDYLTGQSFSSLTQLNSLDLGTLSSGDQFILTVGINGTRSLTSEVILYITSLGTGSIIGPINTDEVRSQTYSPSSGAFTYTFSSTVIVNAAGSLQLDLYVDTDAGTVSAASLGLSVQFIRKA